VAGGLNKNQQADLFQRLSGSLLPRAGKKLQRLNASLSREMWRTAASLELLPIQTKTQLGDELAAKVKKGELVETGLWCLGRIGARKLFYGPSNQVVPASTATRWIEAVVKIEQAEDAVGAMARRTGDGSRDVAGSTMDLVRRAFPEIDLEGAEGDRLASMGKVFGEELPEGLVFGSAG